MGNSATMGEKPNMHAGCLHMAVLLAVMGVVFLIKASPCKGDLLPIVDISGEKFRQTVVAEGTKDRYEGHPTTLLADDGRTMFCVWTIGHGGFCGPAARSDDGGKTWTRIDSALPAVYGRTHRNCPVLQKIKGPDDKVRYFIYSAKAREGSGTGLNCRASRNCLLECRRQGFKYSRTARLPCSGRCSRILPAQNIVQQTTRPYGWRCQGMVVVPMVKCASSCRWTIKTSASHVV